MMSDQVTTEPIEVCYTLTQDDLVDGIAAQQRGMWRGWRVALLAVPALVGLAIGFVRSEGWDQPADSALIIAVASLVLVLLAVGARAADAPAASAPDTSVAGQLAPAGEPAAVPAHPDHRLGRRNQLGPRDRGIDVVLVPVPAVRRDGPSPLSCSRPSGSVRWHWCFLSARCSGTIRPGCAQRVETYSHPVR